MTSTEGTSKAGSALRTTFGAVLFVAWGIATVLWIYSAIHALTDLDRRTEIVRLGQGVDATGEFAPEALQRTFAVTRRYAELIRDAGIRIDGSRGWPA